MNREMKVNSVKLNFILNTLRLLLGALFVLVTTPYITRILGAENLGKVDYVNSIITYFILFTALGIPSYGIREVARVRDDERDRTKIVLELGIILIIMTVLGYIVLIFLVTYLDKLTDLKQLIFIMSVGIVFNNVGFEWFYQGIENQLYITKRFIIVRIITLVVMFLSIKSQEHYLFYGMIIVMMNSGSNILNLINMRKYISLKLIKFKDLEIKKHVKPILIIFAASLSVSIYLQLDIVMLGAVGEKYVAYYTVPNKLIRLALVIVTALGSVLLPRISNCVKKQDKDNYNIYLNYSLKYILLISVPLVFGIFLQSENIIYIMAGTKFYNSIITIKILAPLIFIVGIAYFMGYQILYPLGKEKYYTYSVTVAAIVNFIFNYIMIPKYYQNGAAMGTIIAEITGILLMLFFTRDYLRDIKFYSLENLIYFIASFIMGISIIFLKSLNFGILKEFILSLILGVLIYILVLFILKEKIITEGYKLLKKRIKKV